MEKKEKDRKEKKICEHYSAEQLKHCGTPTKTGL